MSAIVQLEEQKDEVSDVPLTEGEGTVPSEIHRILAENLRLHSNELKEPEETETVVYCSPPPPILKNLLSGRFSLGVMLSSLSLLFMGLISRAPYWVILIVLLYAGGILLGFYFARAEFFGYRVVTNLRAAYVIPQKAFYMFKPEVSRQVFFQSAFQHIVSPSPRSIGMLNKCLAVAVSSKSKSNTGTILFNGVGSQLTFRNTPNFASLIENIVAIAQQLISTSPGTEHVEVQESYVPKDGQKGTKYNLARASSIFMFFLFGLLFSVFLLAMIVGDWEAAAVFFGIGIVTLSIGYSFVCTAAIQKVYYEGMMQHRTTLIGSATHGQELIFALDANGVYRRFSQFLFSLAAFSTTSAA